MTKDRAGGRHVEVSRVARELREIHASHEARVRRQRLEFRSEEHQPGGAVHEERLLAEPVAHERECARLRVPERDREHSREALERVAEPPLFHGGEDHLGVRMPAKRVASRRELAAKRPVVVDLPVERDHVPAARRSHRLMARRRHVEDREPTETESHAGVGVVPLTRVVGAAMLERRGHPPERRAESGAPLGARREDARKTAHGRGSPS